MGRITTLRLEWQASRLLSQARQATRLRPASAWRARLSPQAQFDIFTFTFPFARGFAHIARSTKICSIVRKRSDFAKRFCVNSSNTFKEAQLPSRPSGLETAAPRKIFRRQFILAAGRRP